MQSEILYKRNEFIILESISMKKSKITFWLIPCLFVASMFLCVLLAVIDNYGSVEGNIINQIIFFFIFYASMFMFFVCGACIWGYENLGNYFINNIVFYSLFFATILAIVIICIKIKKIEN